MVSAVARAVPPVTQPPQLKPTIIVSTTEATQHQKATVLDGRASLHRCPTLRLSRFVSMLWPPPPSTLVGRRPAAPGCLYPCAGPEARAGKMVRRAGISPAAPTA